MGFGLILLLILYVIWDVNYFIRCVFTVFMGRLFQRKRKISETTTIYGNASGCFFPHQKDSKFFFLAKQFFFIIFFPLFL